MFFATYGQYFFINIAHTIKKDKWIFKTLYAFNLAFPLFYYHQIILDLHTII